MTSRRLGERANRVAHFCAPVFKSRQAEAREGSRPRDPWFAEAQVFTG